jgi:hypothetical protein
MEPRQGGRDRNVVIDELLYEMRCIQARMEAMETTQRREPDIGDVNESEDTCSDEETKGYLGGETIE